ncbi:FAD-binding protein [Spirosoma montaniterrae]|uniref:FAD-binding protein n=1 Tax=Spirosoma montaniterrae TaxID=1178516 RepID=A0A1P9X0X7_9BACT|nr:FAD-binding protein [Spirosoma montaniterrae]AQG81235.1 FAD-binding protein [Spirosoma montaniterrae]
MDKRTFLKTSSVLLSSSLLPRLTACQSQAEPRTNWAGNLTYSTDNLYTPKTVAEVQEVVKKCDKLRPLGTRHSFNQIADSVDNQLSLQNLNKIVSLDRQANTVTVEGGMRYGELCQYLHQNGYALHNLASLPHISVAGACATATHGSGLTNGNLATAVTAIEFVDAAGNTVNLSQQKDGDTFRGAVVGLGSLGVVTKVTLRLQPTFMAKQAVYRNMPMSALADSFETIMGSGYSVSLFTTWQNDIINQVWIKSVVEDSQKPGTLAPEFYGAKLADRNMHPLDDHSAENCTEQMGVPGPWFERLPHFKMGFTPSSGKELQSEYFVPVENAYKALLAINSLGAKITPLLFVSEVRTIAADTLWMSPCYGQTCVAFHFTWKPDWASVQKVLPQIEAQLAPFNARPHWGKLFTMPPSVLQGRIQKLVEFKRMMRQYDPDEKFRNAFINNALFSNT